MRFSSARVAIAFLVAGLAWIGVTDLAMVGAGGLSEKGFLVASGKGALFVVLSTMFVYLLCRREFHISSRAISLLQAVVEGTSDAVYVKDRQGRYLLVNDATARFLGKQQEEVIGKGDSQLFTPAGANLLKSIDQRIIATGEAEINEETLDAAGVARTYHSVKGPYRDQNGKVVGVIGISRDISDRKAAEQALRLSEAKFRELFNSLPQIVWTANDAGEVTSINTYGIDYAGFPECDLLGWNWQKAIHPDDLGNVIDIWKQIRSDGIPLPVELRVRRADGEYRWHICRQTPIRNTSQEIVSWVGTYTDIHDLKRTENVLRETDERFREAQRIAKLGSWSWEPSSDKVWWSDAEYELFGLDRHELKPSFNLFLSLVHPDDREVAVSRVDALRHGANEFANDLRIIRPDGQKIWVSSRAKATRDSHGNLIRVEGIDQDITNERLAEISAKNSENRLNSAVEVAGLGIITVDYKTQAAVLSHRAAEQFGFPPDAKITRNDLHSRFHPDDRVKLESLIVDATKPNGTGWFNLEHRVIRPDGSVRWLNVRKQVFFADSQPEHAVVVTVDATDRRLAEEALRESEERYRLLFESNPHPMWVYDVKTLRFLAVNDAAVRTYGYSREEFLARTIKDIRPKEDLPRLEAVVAQLQPGLSYHRQWRHCRKDGNVIDVDVSSHDLQNTGGRARLVLALDVTERIKAEEALRASEERMQEAARVAGFGVFDHDHTTETFYWSPRLRQIYGLELDTPVDLNEFIQLIHPEDRESIHRAVKTAHDPKGEGRFDVEHRLIRRSDGVVRWVATRSSTRFEGEGPNRRPIRTIGATVDITTAKEFAEALKDSEERFRRLVTVLPTAVLVHDGERVLYCNPAFVRLVGAATESEVVSRPLFSCVYPDDRPLVKARFAKMLETEEGATGVDIRFVRSDGRPVPTHSVTTPITGYGLRAYLVALTDLTERERATALLRSVLNSVGDAILTIDSLGTVTSANMATRRMFGYVDEELVGKNVKILMPEPYRTDHDDYINNFLRTGIAKVIGVGREVEGRRKDGTTFPAELTVSEFQQDGERRFTGVLRDITARRRLEDQFRQSQKMEAVGRLAGGVAHDFNNLLTVINGYADMLMADLTVGDPSREPLAAIQDAGERAARLTQQLLAFSRKSMIAPVQVDLNELTAESAKMLRRLIGEDITVAVLADNRPVRVVIDPGQLEQVLMNLVVNARDAMPTGGLLTIETRNVEITPGSNFGHSELSPGRYAKLRITDTGCGMSEEIRNKIFEPFFTTKGIGKGTGLGLAVVHGVVKQAGGSVIVESKIGAGTTFSVLLPSSTETTVGESSGVLKVAVKGNETILVVEDEDAVRTLVKVALELQGYKVLLAANGEKALDVFRSNQAQVRLLVTDVIMPGMSGRELADAIRLEKPDLKILYMSGYTDDALDRHGLESASEHFIQKPFAPLGLARKVRAILDQSP